MPPSPFSRRQFLGDSLKAGAGAAAVGLTGLGGRAWAAPGDRPAAETTITQPPTPKSVQSFVSRPDLTPPGVSISTTTDVETIPDQPQYIFLTPRPNSSTKQPIASQGLMICNLAGQLVWWQQEGTASNACPFNFRVQTYNGDPVLTYCLADTGTGYGVDGTGYVLNGDYATTETVSTDLYSGMDLHEFLITPQDTALITSYENDTKATGLIYGHALEIDIATNELLWDWSSQGQVTLAQSYTTGSDYFHINSIDLWPGTARNVLISSRQTWCVYLIDRATKDIAWRVGGKDSSFTMGAGTGFEYAHDARPLADGSGFSLFDDASPAGKGAPPTPEKQSWGKVFTVDTDTEEVSLVNEFNHPDGTIDTPSQGNNQLLPTGGHVVGYGAVPRFTLFAPSKPGVDPTAILDGRLPGDMNTYRAFMFDWTGTPPESEIALIVHTASGTGNFTAYMSWNGATEVVSWRINAGTSTEQTQLPSMARKTKNGFETIIPFTKVGATEFQAVALDANGNALGRSAIVKVSS